MRAYGPCFKSPEWGSTQLWSKCWPLQVLSLDDCSHGKSSRSGAPSYSITQSLISTPKLIIPSLLSPYCHNCCHNFHNYHYFQYHRLHCPLCIKLIISSILHIILTHRAALIGTAFRIHDEKAST